MATPLQRDSGVDSGSFVFPSNNQKQTEAPGDGGSVAEVFQRSVSQDTSHQYISSSNQGGKHLAERQSLGLKKISTVEDGEDGEVKDKNGSPDLRDSDKEPSTIKKMEQLNLSEYDPSSGKRFHQFVFEENKDLHEKANNIPFIKKLSDGKLGLATEQDKKDYIGYVCLLYCEYSCLEKLAAESKTLPSEIKEFMVDAGRTEALAKDYSYLAKSDEVPEYRTLNSSNQLKNYIEYLNEIKNDPVKFMAHIFCRCGADLAGGQILGYTLRKKQHWPQEALNHYNFGSSSEDVRNLKKKLHKILDGIPEKNPEDIDLFVKEVSRAFKETIRVYQAYSSSLETL